MSYLRRLLGLCVHTWDDIRTLSMKYPDDGRIISLAVVQRCSKCGDYRTVWH